MKKMKKVLIMGITTVMLGMNFLGSGIIENLPKVNNLSYVQAYKHNAENILENVFENNGLTILPFIFENSDQTITKDYLIKQFEKAGLKIENEKELKSVIATGDKIKTASKTYTVLIYGDVNKDGIVDTFDAERIIFHYVFEGKYTLTGIDAIAANVKNDDKDIDTFDAERIIRFYVGFETKLVVNEPEGSKIPEEPKKEKPEYTVPTGLKAIYGETLNDVKLPEGFTFEDDLTTKVGNVGTNKFKVTYTPKDTDKYEIVTGIEVEITVEKAEPENVPALKTLSAVYGTLLKDVKLPTGWAFTNKAENATVGDVNSKGNEFKVTYTPTDIKNYKTIESTVLIIVTKQDEPEKEKPEYTVPTGLKATYGKTLNDVKLPEGFTFEDKLTTKVGNVGTNTFKVTYTPEDTDKFQIVTGIEVEIEVSKAVLTESVDYTVPTNLKATYGDKLKDVTGTGLTTQWKFIKEDGTDAKEELVGNANAEGNEFKLQFIPTDGVENYEEVIVTVKVVVEKAEPENVPALRTLRKAKGTLLKDIELPAGWAFKDTSETATVGDTVNLNGKEFDVIYTPSNLNNYKTKEGKVLIIVVAGQLVEGVDYTVPTNLKATYGDKLKDVTGTGLTAQWKFIKEDGTDAKEESVGNANAEGNEFKLQFIPTDGVENYEEVIVTVKVVVEKAEPENVPELTTLTKVQGTFLKDINLPEGWAFKDTSETATVGEPNAEGNEIPVIYTSPITPENYKTKDDVIKIIVIKPLLTVTANIPDKKDYYYCGDKITIEVSSGANEEKITNLTWKVTKTDAVQGENEDYTTIANVEQKDTKADGTIVLEISIDETGIYEFTPIAENAETNANVTPVNIVVRDNPVVGEVIFKDSKTEEIITTAIEIHAQKTQLVNVEFKNEQNKPISVDASRIISLLKIKETNSLDTTEDGTPLLQTTEDGTLLLQADGIEVELMTKVGEQGYTKITNVNSTDSVDRIRIKPISYTEGHNEKTLIVEVKNTGLGIDGATNKKSDLKIKVLEEMPQVVRVTEDPETTQPTTINLYLGSSKAEANIKPEDEDKVIVENGKLYTIIPIYEFDGEQKTPVKAGSLSSTLADGKIRIVDDLEWPCITFQRYYSEDGKNFTPVNEFNGTEQVEGFDEMDVNYIGIAIGDEDELGGLQYVHIYNDAMTTESGTGEYTDKIKLNVTVQNKKISTVIASIPDEKEYYYSGDKITIEVSSGKNEEDITNLTNLDWTVIKTDAEVDEDNDYKNKAHRVTGSNHGIITFEFIVDEEGIYEFTPIIEGASSTPVNIVVRDNPVVGEVIFRDSKTEEIITTAIEIHAQKTQLVNVEFKNEQNKTISVDASRIINLLKIKETNSLETTEDETPLLQTTEDGTLLLQADGIEVELMTKVGEQGYTKITNVNSTDSVDRIRIKPISYTEGHNEKTLIVEVKNTGLGIDGVTNKKGDLKIKVLEEMPQVVRVTEDPEAIQPTSINLYLGNSITEENIKTGDIVKQETNGKLYTIIPIYEFDGEQKTPVKAGSLSSTLADGKIRIVDDLEWPCITFQRYYSEDGKNFTPVNEFNGTEQVEGFDEMDVNYIGIAIGDEDELSGLQYVHIYNDEMTTESGTGEYTDKIKLNVTVIPEASNGNTDNTEGTESTTNQ